MSEAEQVETTDELRVALAMRLERDLASCWEGCVVQAISSLRNALPEGRSRVLHDCFSRGAEEIAAIVHTHFPQLLVFAEGKRESLQIVGDVTPISWTSTQLRVQVGNFLGIDPESADTASPSAASRVAEGSRQILSLAGCLPQGPEGEFLLPRWAEISLAAQFTRLFLRDFPLTNRDDLGDRVSTYDAECMTPSETAAWIRDREIDIWNRLERQLQDEVLDAYIEAGVVTSGNSGLSKNVAENVFVRSGTGWIIRFGGAERAFSHSEGFSLLHILLSNAGRSFSPPELETLSGGHDLSTGRPKEYLSDGFGTAPSKQSIESLSGIRGLLREIQGYEELIRECEESGNTVEARLLQKERDQLRAQVEPLTRPGGKLKEFAGDETRSAKRVQTNISRAVREIANHLPQFGQQLRTFLKTGTEVAYLDTSTVWRFVK